MTIGTYDTHTLMRVVETLRPPTNFWLSLGFPSTQLFDTEFVDFDVVDRGRRLAPFVAPTAQGKPMLQEGYSTRRFKPAYIKPKDAVNPTRVFRRQPGEIYAGSMSAEQRRQAVIADILMQHRNMVERRWEWMACEAIVNGAVTISGEDYPSVTVTFGRAGSQSKNLTGTNRWSESTSKPLQDWESWRIETHRLSGYSPNIVVMGLNAWNAFRVHADVQKALNTEIRGTQSSLEIATGTGLPFERRGYIGSNLEIWTYNDIYEDNSGTAVEFFNQDSVLLTSRAVDGVRCFGAILDARAGYQPAAMYPKMWLQEDPSAEFLMVQSAPLMVPTRPNATLLAKVLNAS